MNSLQQQKAPSRIPGRQTPGVGTSSNGPQPTESILKQRISTHKNAGQEDAKTRIEPTSEPKGSPPLKKGSKSVQKFQSNSNSQYPANKISGIKVLGNVEIKTNTDEQTTQLIQHQIIDKRMGGRNPDANGHPAGRITLADSGRSSALTTLDKFNQSLYDVNSPTRDQQVLFDRAGNSQDYPSNYQEQNFNNQGNSDINLGNQNSGLNRQQSNHSINSSSLLSCQASIQNLQKYYSEHSPSQSTKKMRKPDTSDVIFSYDKQPSSRMNSYRQSNFRKSAGSKRKEPALLQPQSEQYAGKKVLVLDLDETLVHSSFKKVKNADIQQPIDLDGYLHTVYVNVRPFAEEFILAMSKCFEIIMFTASIQKYAQPIFNKLDPERKCQGMLFREHCTVDAKSGFMVKDLTRLGRNIEDIIIIDNSPNSYHFQPENALPSKTWLKDKEDFELKEMMPFLRKLAHSSVKDVRNYLSKVIDITAGSKTPVFNKRKAGQIMKLMEKSPAEFNHEFTRKTQQKPNLKASIQKAQHNALLRKERESNERMAVVQHIYKPLLQPQSLIYKYEEGKRSPMAIERSGSSASIAQRSFAQSQDQSSNLGPARISNPIFEDERSKPNLSSRFNRNQVELDDYQTPKLGGQGTPIVAKKQDSRTQTPQAAANQNSKQLPIESADNIPSFSNTLNVKNTKSDADQIPKQVSNSNADKMNPQEQVHKGATNDNLTGSQNIENLQEIQVKDEFQHINDNDINQITNYYYQKYKTKKRRRSSLNRELRKIEKIQNQQQEAVSDISRASRVSSRQVGVNQELEQKREEIMQKFIRLEGKEGENHLGFTATADNSSPRKDGTQIRRVPYTQQLLKKKKQQLLNQQAHQNDSKTNRGLIQGSGVPVEEKIIFSGYAGGRAKSSNQQNSQKKGRREQGVKINNLVDVQNQLGTPNTNGTAGVVNSVQSTQVLNTSQFQDVTTSIQDLNPVIEHSHKQIPSKVQNKQQTATVTTSNHRSQKQKESDASKAAILSHLQNPARALFQDKTKRDASDQIITPKSSNKIEVSHQQSSFTPLSGGPQSPAHNDSQIQRGNDQAQHSRRNLKALKSVSTNQQPKTGIEPSAQNKTTAGGKRNSFSQQRDDSFGVKVTTTYNTNTQVRNTSQNSNRQSRRGSNSRNVLQRSNSHTSRNSAKLAGGASATSFASGRGSQSGRRKGNSGNISGTNSAAVIQSFRGQTNPNQMPQKSHRSTASNKKLISIPSSARNGNKPSLVSQYEQKITQMVQNAKQTAASHVDEAKRRKTSDSLLPISPGPQQTKKHIIQTSVNNNPEKNKVPQENQTPSVYFNNQQPKQQDPYTKLPQGGSQSATIQPSSDPVNSSLEDLKLQNKILREQFQSMINRNNIENQKSAGEPGGKKSSYLQALSSKQLSINNQLNSDYPQAYGQGQRVNEQVSPIYDQKALNRFDNKGPLVGMSQKIEPRKQNLVKKPAQGNQENADQHKRSRLSSARRSALQTGDEQGTKPRSKVPARPQSSQSTTQNQQRNSELKMTSAKQGPIGSNRPQTASQSTNQFRPGGVKVISSGINNSVYTSERGVSVRPPSRHTQNRKKQPANPTYQSIERLMKDRYNF